MQSFHERYADTPRLCREPYRVLFPAGVAIAWGGVLHWVLHSAGVFPDYRPVFHAIAQVQGFMTCLALGFLLTMIPRRTSTPPPGRGLLAAAVLLPAITTIAGWFEWLALSQVAWVLLVVLLIGFVVRRFRSGREGRRPPVAFVWIPIALLMGLGGSFLIASPAFLGEEYFWLHQLGRLFLLQGFLLGLVAGVGSMAIPLITRGESPPDGSGAPRDAWLRLAHLLAAAALAASFWIEITVSAARGLALRAAVMSLLLIVGARIWRLPRKAGWHRWLVWLAAWMIPIGYWLAAAYPMQKKAGMHFVFIGGFALMGLTVAIHVSLAHGRSPDSVHGRPWQVPLFGGLILLSMVARALVDFDPNRFFLWIGLAGGVFLVGTVFWGWLVLPATLDRIRDR